MVSTLDLAGGYALVRSGNRRTALRLVAAEAITQRCDDASGSEGDAWVHFAYGLDWYDMLGMFRA